MHEPDRHILTPPEVVALLTTHRGSLLDEGASIGASPESIERVLGAIVKLANNEQDQVRPFTIPVKKLPKGPSAQTTDYARRALVCVGKFILESTESNDTVYALLAYRDWSPADKKAIPSGRSGHYAFFKYENVTSSVSSSGNAGDAIHIGFVNYPPLITEHSDDLYHFLFSLIQPHLEHSLGLPTVRHSDLDLDEATRRLIDTKISDNDRLDCIFGVFETPARIRTRFGAVGTQSAFCAILHTVLLMAVTEDSGQPLTLSEITGNADSEFYCVDGEVGAEFITEILQYRRIDRSLRFDDDRVRLHSSRRDLSFLLHMLLHPSDRPRVAFIDGITATTYLTQNPGAKLRAIDSPMPAYGNGIWVRPDHPIGARLSSEIATLAWKHRMTPEFLKREKQLLEPYKSVITAIHRPAPHG